MLGIVDWGIGGVGFFQAFRRRHPEVPVVYLSDTGSVPYGKLPRAALAARIDSVLAQLASRGATHVVVACNAASTVLPRASRVPFTGVIEHGIRAALSTRARSIGIIGGIRTIRSGVYRRALIREGRAVEQRIAQPLSARIEAGDLDSPETRADVARIVSPLRGVGAMVMACTHYPAIAPLFRDVLGNVTLVDPVPELTRWIERSWDLPRMKARPVARFLTTGDPVAMRVAAGKAFGEAIPRVRKISI